MTSEDVCQTGGLGLRPLADVSLAAEQYLSHFVWRMEVKTVLNSNIRVECEVFKDLLVLTHEALDEE